MTILTPTQLQSVIDRQNYETPLRLQAFIGEPFAVLREYVDHFNTTPLIGGLQGKGGVEFNPVARSATGFIDRVVCQHEFEIAP